MKREIPAAILCIALSVSVRGAAPLSDTDNRTQVTVPAWVFPSNTPALIATASPDAVTPVRVPGSSLTYTLAQLGDRFSAPGWFPQTHSPLPAIVAHGRKPDVYACGYCHTPGGQGRPENASLAGLPAAYIIRQVADFKSGVRRSEAPGAYGPIDLMIGLAAHATDAEVAAAAEYFARQRLRSRVRVVESDRVPQSQVVGWVYAALPGGGDEPIGERLMEFAPDPARHEERDDAMKYLAYVPRGSLNRGRSLARTGAGGPATACIACHGKSLQGAGLVPPLAGRSPTYLLRQLFAFQSGARSGATGQPMRPVVAGLKTRDMIAVAAFSASLPPRGGS